MTIYRKNIGEMFNQKNVLQIEVLLKEREKKIFEIITYNPSISIKEISEILSVSYKTIQRDLSHLKTIYGIEWVGSAKNGHWVVTS